MATLTSDGRDLRMAPRPESSAESGRPAPRTGIHSEPACRAQVVCSMTVEAAWTITNVGEGESPLVVHVPHAGTWLPDGEGSLSCAALLHDIRNDGLLLVVGKPPSDLGDDQIAPTSDRDDVTLRVSGGLLGHGDILPAGTPPALWMPTPKPSADSWLISGSPRWTTKASLTDGQRRRGTVTCHGPWQSVRSERAPTAPWS